MKIKIKAPTQKEIMDYCVEHFTRPTSNAELDKMHAIADARLIAKRKKIALKKRGIEFEIV